MWTRILQCHAGRGRVLQGDHRLPGTEEGTRAPAGVGEPWGVSRAAGSARGEEPGYVAAFVGICTMNVPRVDGLRTVPASPASLASITVCGALPSPPDPSDPEPSCLDPSPASPLDCCRGSGGQPPTGVWFQAGL